MAQKKKRRGGQRRRPATPPKKAEAPPAPREWKPHSLNLYITDPMFDAVLKLLTAKWYAEGKIPEPKVSLAVQLMVHDFGLLAQHESAANNGSFALDDRRRKKFALLGDTFQATGVIRGKSDAEVLDVSIDYLYEMFRDERILQRLVDRARQR